MRILFVNYHHLNSNSGIHIFNLANCLSTLGMECTVCVPQEKEAVRALGTPHFDVIEMAGARAIGGRDCFDLIHAWTPREIVRTMTQELVQIYNCPYVVHLEDNEEALLASDTGMAYEMLAQLPAGELEAILPHTSHIRINTGNSWRAPWESRSSWTPCSSSVPRENPRRSSGPATKSLLPWSMQPDLELRARLGIPETSRVVAYTGNVHATNRQEVFSLYLAVGLLNRRGLRTWLIRTGTDFVRLIDSPLSMLTDQCISLGHVPRRDLPSILSIADVLVQPGRPDAFNAYRFPSKLPEFLASGRPVLLPAVNIGRFMQDQIECLLLKRGDALEIATGLERLFGDQVLRETIGSGGRRFAERNLPWNKSADKLAAFYRNLLSPPRSRPA